MYRDYKDVGNDLWSRFNAGVEKQAWYYGKMTDALYELQHYPETADFYWEMLGLYKDVFVIFSIDTKEDIIYQKNLAGEVYRLKMEKPEWSPYDSVVPENAVVINRKFAERLEDHWCDLYEEKTEECMLDDSFPEYISS